MCRVRSAAEAHCYPGFVGAWQNGCNTVAVWNNGVCASRIRLIEETFEKNSTLSSSFTISAGTKRFSSFREIFTRKGDSETEDDAHVRIREISLNLPDIGWRFIQNERDTMKESQLFCGISGNFIEFAEEMMIDEENARRRRVYSYSAITSLDDDWLLLRCYAVDLPTTETEGTLKNRVERIWSSIWRLNANWTVELPHRSYVRDRHLEDDCPMASTKKSFQWEGEYICSTHVLFLWAHIFHNPHFLFPCWENHRNSLASL